MSHYAEIVNGVVANVALCDDAAFAQSQGWTDIDAVTPQPGVGWTYNGTTFTPPPVPVITINEQDTVAQVANDLKMILTWLANNPNGAVLTAAQTRVLARILANLCIYDLRDFTQPPVTT